MMSFKDYLKESVLATTRQGMVHLQKMPDIEFVEFIRSIKHELGGKLDNMRVSLKVDGLGARMGITQDGQPFFEGSRTGPITTSKAFSTFAKNRGNATEEILIRAGHYDDMYEIITKSNFIKKLPRDSKVICEILYNPMGQLVDDGIKFVSIKYDRNKLGEILTIVPFKVVVASTGADHPESDKIIQMLYKSSDRDIKFINPQLTTKGTIDISGIIDPVMSLQGDALNVLTSRKHSDRAEKQAIKDIIQLVKNKVAEYILYHPTIIGKSILGNEIEGLVLNINGRDIKVTTPEFKQSKVKQ
jgi:hypothetical protein